MQAFEPRLTATLAGRWPDRMPEVLAWDGARAWLLTADAGRALGDLGNPPEQWAAILPRYAEVQRGEVVHVASHLANGVPNLTTSTLPSRYEELLGRDLPVEAAEVGELRAFAPRFEALCGELATASFADTIQHDDLHLNSVFAGGDGLRILDWGDTSIAFPFFSLVVTFQFLVDHNGLAQDDRWFGRLRDAYLEGWGSNLVPDFELAFRVGTVAHAFTWLRHREAMSGDDRTFFDGLFPDVLRRAIAALRAA